VGANRAVGVIEPLPVPGKGRLAQFVKVVTAHHYAPAGVHSPIFHWKGANPEPIWSKAGVGRAIELIVCHHPQPLVPRTTLELNVQIEAMGHDL
jgi:hypothetical protein